MKLIEKLALEHRDRNTCPGVPDHCVDRCFEAGFRKAREMAAETLRTQAQGYEQEYNRFNDERDAGASQGCESAADQIRALGEGDG